VVRFVVTEYDLTISFPSPSAGINETIAYCKYICAGHLSHADCISCLSSFYLSQREEVIERHEKGWKEREKRLNEMKKKVEDHESGKQELSKDDYEDLLKSIPVYEEKIKKLQKPLDEDVS
jgi:hypothetical protein